MLSVSLIKCKNEALKNVYFKSISNAVVTPLRKVATYEPRIKEKLHELGKSKRIMGH